MRPARLTPHAKLILWLVAVPLALVALYVALLVGLWLDGRVSVDERIELGGGQAIFHRDYHYLPARVQAHTSELLVWVDPWLRRVVGPGYGLWSLAHRRPARSDDRLLVLLQGRVLPLLPVGTTYDRADFTTGAVRGGPASTPVLGLVTGGTTSSLWIFNPPASLTRMNLKP